MDNVFKLVPKEVGEDYRFDPNEILEKAKDQGFTSVYVVGQLEDGSIWVSGSGNAGEALIALELAKHDILFGED